MGLILIDEEQIVIFTGEISPDKRSEMWKNKKIIISTPQVIQNDLISKRMALNNVSLIIFDEAHHAVGDYAYVFVSEQYQKQNANRHIIGMTASPGNDIEKILEVCKNLDINNIEIRTKNDADVKPYVHDLKIQWKEIKLPNDFSLTIQVLRKALSDRLKKLYSIGAIESSSILLINKRKLLDAQNKIQIQIRDSLKPSKKLYEAASIQSEALKIHYAIELLQTQGVYSLKSFFDRIVQEARSKGGSKASKSIINDNNIIEAMAQLNTIESDHPKLNEIKNIISRQFNLKKDSKTIVFTHYRDTSIQVTKILEEIPNCKPVRFIGQARKENDKGLTQKQQAEVVKKFKEGVYNVLIATSVAEEGLDIPSTDLVVFYEPIPSEIRNIQRRGRTARKMSGKVIILITKGTPDEGYYWASKKREKLMRSELELLRSKLSKSFENPKLVYEKPDEQKTLKEYDNNEDSVKIIVDNREYRSPVVKLLVSKGIDVESQQLDVGDYVLSSRIGVERKTDEDFLDSLMSGKLFRQLQQLRDSYSRPLMIIEGENLFTKRNISHNALFGSLISIIVDFGISIIPTKNHYDTADLLYVAAKREQKTDKKSVALRGEKTSMPLNQRQQFIIEGLPNISSTLAKRLLDHFGSIRNIMNASFEELQEVNGIGKNIAREIISIINAGYLEK